MNDLHHPCENWAERISLAAAGCLSADEEQEVRRHIETCSDCRERFRQLTELCGMLAEAQLPAVGPEAAIVQRVMLAITSGCERSLQDRHSERRIRHSERRIRHSGRSEESDIGSRPNKILRCAQNDSVRTPAEMIHRTLLTRSLTKWRWIMRHPVSLATAAAIFVLAVIGVAFWFHAGGTTPAFAEFIEPILNPKTVKYKITVDMTDMPALSPAMARMMGLSTETQKDLSKATAEEMMLDANRSRTEWEELPGKSKPVQIWDGNQGKTLWLYPAEKKASVFNDDHTPKDRSPNGDDPVARWRSLLLDARDNPNVKGESLGEKVIDGRRVIGFRINSHEAVMNVWGDPKTGLPARIEITTTLMPKTKLTMSDFEFNVDMDESLFSVEPPAGYEVTEEKQVHAHEAPPAETEPVEKDLIEMFRCYGQWSGGRFPDLLDMMWLSQIIHMEEWTAANIARPPKTMEERDQVLADAQAKVQRGMTFVISLPKEADSHYAGKGVSLDAADTPVFWYRPKDGKTYRVAYADLSVREADTPPSVPEVNLEKDLIEMFRQYSELSGGPFPLKLDMGSVTQIVWMEAQIKNNSEEQPRKSGAKQEQDMAEAQVKLLRGLIFTGLLPPEADAHYAGKGVSLGAADMPIYWYHPKDSKKYRIIYADLSVRESETPPNVPVALPEADLIDTFREYCELNGGPFPAKLDLASLLLNVSMKLVVKYPPEDGQTPSAKHLQEMMKAQMKLQPGLDFTGSLPPEADAHYVGRGVLLGAADTPIFWYRPKDSKTYRVIYADLSVRQSETPPSAPAVQPEQDLIDALRYYSELSGGPFPDSLDKDNGELSPVLEKKFHLEKGQKPNAKQTQEIIEISMKFLPGKTFIEGLPPEADAHYAGKGVSLGAADAPIFWYRPKDSKTYRIIYADLSVRQSDTPPNVRDAQPVPAPSTPKK